jgi:hypothetical protein
MDEEAEIAAAWNSCTETSFYPSTCGGVPLRPDDPGRGQEKASRGGEAK